MRHLAGLSAVVAILFTATLISAQEGNVITQHRFTLPRDAFLGEETLTRGPYSIELVELPSPPEVGGAGQSELWFVVKRNGQEVIRDVAIEVSPEELPIGQGWRAEMLKGDEYFRLAVRTGASVYLLHFPLRGA